MSDNATMELFKRRLDEIADTNNKLVHENKELRERVSMLEDEVTTLRGTVITLEHDKAQTQIQLTALKHDKSQMQIRLTALTQEKAQMKIELTALKHDKAHMQTQLTALKRDKARIQDQLNNHAKLLDTVMNTTVAPIVAAVVYKSMYKLLYPVNSDTEFNDPYEHLTENILKRKESYGEVGLRSKSEMVQFSSSLPTVLNRRNRGAHSTRGDDVLRCRPWFSPIVKLIVIRGFSKLFRTYPEVWEHAKPELKAIVIYNSSDRALKGVQVVEDDDDECIDSSDSS